MTKDWFKFDRRKGEITIERAFKEKLIIQKEDLEISYFSGGAGGQNVNRHMNGVRLIYKIPQNHLLSFKKTSEFVSRSINHRNKEQNFKDALADLANKIQKYFYVPPRRKKTSIPRGSKQRRLESKKYRGFTKENRKKVDF